MTSWYTGLAVAAAVLVLATAFGVIRRVRDGRAKPVSVHPADEILSSLGVAPGTRLTLLQFSSTFCTPCRATRQVCADVAADIDGVRHVEVDAAAHLDAVQALHIRRTPTLLLVDSRGQVVRRAAGTPQHDQLRTAVREALTEAA